MKDSTRSLLNKIWKFLITSGIGFILDFITFTILSQVLGMRVLYANYLSSLVGATFAFIVSTHKIFDTNRTRIPLWAKYLMYIIYQLVLIFLVSYLGDMLDSFIVLHPDWGLIYNYHKLACKVIITPITMTCNFLVMRSLSEKI